MRVMAVDGVILSQHPFSILCVDAFEIRRLSSVFLRVRTNVGVRVLYDREGLRLYLQVDQRWVEDTVGLCGTFNGNTQDDFLYVPGPGTGRRGGGGALKTICTWTLSNNISPEPPWVLTVQKVHHWLFIPQHLNFKYVSLGLAW